MSTLKIHHIGYLVKRMDSAIQSFETIGYQISQNTIYDDIRKVTICFMQKDGYCIELVAPTSADSVVAGLMKRYKNSPYHICYETKDYEKDYQLLTSSGFIAMDTPTSAPALQGREVVFLTSASAGMIELIKS